MPTTIALLVSSALEAASMSSVANRADSDSASTSTTPIAALMPSLVPIVRSSFRADGPEAMAISFRWTMHRSDPSPSPGKDGSLSLMAKAMEKPA